MQQANNERRQIFTDAVRCIVLKAVTKISVEILAGFLEKEIRLKLTDRFLLAVSGGADSMLMLHLMHKIGYSIEVAHVNYGLRGTESDGDEELVKQVCADLTIPFHLKKMNLKEIIEREGGGIQERAREVRYEWFEEIRVQNELDFIATAHNRTDNLETVLMQQIRGTGINGTTGIYPIRKKLIRPMLLFGADAIRDFMQTNKIPFRDDSSNSKPDYTRNQIRHWVLPELLKINDDVEQTFLKNSQHNRQWLELMNDFTDQFKAKNVEVHGDEWRIPLSALTAFSQSHLLLFNLVNRFGFTIDDCWVMMQQTSSGGRIIADRHEMIRHQDIIYITEIKAVADAVVVVNKEGDYRFADGTLSFMIVPNEDLSFDNADVAYLKCSSVENAFPLLIRSWKEGDRMKPFGMKGSKLLSDVMGESGIPVHHRKQIPVIVKDETIQWLVGIKQSEDSRVKREDLGVLRIEWLKDQR